MGGLPKTAVKSAAKILVQVNPDGTRINTMRRSQKWIRPIHEPKDMNVYVYPRSLEEVSPES